MSKKLDKHFKCSKELKRAKALRKLPPGIEKAMMVAEAHAKSVEYVQMTQLVPLPRGMRETPSE